MKFFSVCGFVLFSLLAGFSADTMISRADAAPSLEGRWTGTLSCDRRRASDVVLFLEPDGLRRVKGLLSYGRMTRGGKYQVYGQAQEDGRFRLNAGRWILRAWSGEQPFDVEGRILADGTRMEARLSGCKTGELVAIREVASVSPRSSKSRKSDALSPRALAWAGDIRRQIADFRAGGDDSGKLWRPIQHAIAFNMPHGGSVQLRNELVEALDEARAAIGAEALLARLQKEAVGGDEAVISVAARVASEARRYRWWPHAEVGRVVSAARKRYVEAIRPKLQAIAVKTSDLPGTLGGLIQAREALASIEAQRASMTRAFGAVDPERILEPLYVRIREIEASASLAGELRAALREARAKPDPIGSTAELLRRAFGSTTPASVAGLVKEADEHAIFAAITIEDRSTSRHPGEPTARSYALVLHDRTKRLNDIMAGQEARCRRGRYANVLDATFCAPFLLLDQVGGLRARPVRVTKLGCEVEEAGIQYLCRFKGDIRIHSAKGGLLAPDLTRKLIETAMPGYEGESLKLRFRRVKEPGRAPWDISRIDRPAPPKPNKPPLLCPWGEFDAGGFCMSYDAFD